MSRTNTLSGRLGNQFFINVAASLLAEKYDLYIEYECHNEVQALFPLFVGTKRYPTTVTVNDNNYVNMYNKESIDHNLSFHDYFQSTNVTMLTHIYIKSKMKYYLEHNPYKENNNCFIHIRLGDVAQWNPGASHYQGILSTLKVNRVYLSSDSKDHPIVQTLMKDRRIEWVDRSPKDIILFASQQRYVLLSHGTFSGMIGYLAFFSTIYFVKESESTSWDYYGGNGKFNLFKGKSSKRGEFIEV